MVDMLHGCDSLTAAVLCIFLGMRGVRIACVLSRVRVRVS